MKDKKQPINGLAQIDKNVPMPRSKRGGARRYYPWDDMEIGESFLLRTTKTSGNYIGYANLRYAPKHFVSRKVEDGAIRIWRTE